MPITAAAAQSQAGLHFMAISPLIPANYNRPMPEDARLVKDLAHYRYTALIR
jgi:hypothetical protein